MDFSARSGELSYVSTADLLALAVESVGVDALPDGLDERTILDELQRRGSPDIVDQAVAWCGDRRWTMRCLGADILGQLGNDPELPLSAESEGALLRLLDDADGDVVSAAVTALGTLGLGDTERIAAVVGHPSSTAREAVAWCLGLREEPAAAEGLVTLSRDAIAEVRRSATTGLAELFEVDDDAIRDALAARVDDPDPDTRTQAIMGLALIGDPQAAAAAEKAIGATPGIEELVAMGVVFLDRAEPGADAKPL